jgi:hypothetical protein
MVTSGASEGIVTQATIYLRTTLFTLAKGQPHLPVGSAIVSGELESIGDGGVRMRVTGWRNERGLELKGEPRSLFLPMSKVDHIDLSQDAE